MWKVYKEMKVKQEKGLKEESGEIRKVKETYGRKKVLEKGKRNMLGRKFLRKVKETCSEESS